MWLADPYRATRDVDLLASGPQDDEAIRAMIEAICAVRCDEDGLEFDLGTLKIDSIREEEEYSGKRAVLLAHIGTAKIRVQVDFGFGDAMTTGPEDVEYPTILQNLPAPHVRAYPRVVSIAEKVEAMVKLETRNSRMKDFHDVWAISGTFEFDGQELSDAIVACFERRKTQWSEQTPAVLTAAFYQHIDLQARWNAYLRGSGMRSPPPLQFEEIGERVQQFLMPMRNGILSEAVVRGHWPAGGPWQ